MWIIVERSQSLGSNARFLEIQEKVEKEAALSSTILAQRQLDRCYTFAAKLRRNAKAQVGWKTPSLCWELNHWDQDAVNVDNLCRSRFLFWNQPQIPPYWSVLTHLCPREDIKHARVSCKKQNINKYFISWGSCWLKKHLMSFMDELDPLQQTPKLGMMFLYPSCSLFGKADLFEPWTLLAFFCPSCLPFGRCIFSWVKLHPNLEARCL